jgi:hypothetical protein
MVFVLQAIRANLGQEELQALLQETEAVLDDDAQVGAEGLFNLVGIFVCWEGLWGDQQECDVTSTATMPQQKISGHSLL